jgi:SAM-dependent methyltransferase
VPKQNSAQLWDGLWANGPVRRRELVYSVLKEEQSSLWSQMATLLPQANRKVEDLRAIEIGAGSGTFSAVLARRGMHVTVLDYAENALQASRAVFQDLELNADFVLADALNIDQSLLGKFDVSMSIGLAEHFEGENRLKILQSHFSLLAPGGTAFVCVPNSWCIPYRLWKARREVLGKWRFGLEIPFSRKELAGICERLGVQDYRFFGSPFLASLDFVLPFQRWKRSYMKRFQREKWLNPAFLRPQKTGPFDEYLGYALVLAARKPN